MTTDLLEFEECAVRLSLFRWSRDAGRHSGEWL